ncbi:disease resistance protein RPP2B-like isoform X2 [Ziziphus jujuba]|uniref:Disease resistance protein RPP2B-like isoform X2 n=1 Tax=Ziziphus jujuba TaxID=326968 RepID=A0ABM4AC09_ZIZJJ|nr:disease resistance protein RPP2B-like isoform X2 [Ziziphus jujuba]
MAHAIYESKGLDHRDALQLFCFHAFGPNSLATGYEALIESVAHYAKGNPLALKVLGSSLKSKSIKEWESALEKLKTDADPDILKVLRISFDGLGDKRIQDIFLDMACFFTDGMVREDVESILNRNEHSDATNEIGVLIDKSLLIDRTKFDLEMHDLLRQMGRQIVCDENKDAGNRSRLWNTKDVCRVLERNTGTSTIEGILLNLRGPKRDVNVSRTAFSKMHNLRVLKIMHSYVRYYDKLNHNLDIKEWHEHIYLPDGLDFFISDEIRYFHWDSYPLKYLPYLSPENLVEFIMRDSQLEQLWNEAQPPELVKLKKINLSFSEHLIQIPNLSRAINLQEIHLRYCTRLVHIPPFFRNLNKLQLLDMTECNNLEDGIEHLPINLRYLTMDGTAIKSLPGSIWELKYLEELYLYGCPNLRKIPEISNRMECLVKIALVRTEIEELPESIEHLTELKILILNRWHKIKFLPNSLCKLLHLQQLVLAECSSLEELPPLPHGLETMDIEKCERLKSTAELPSSLRRLDANDCTSLETISSRGSPPKPPFRHNGCSYWFMNCLKLDEDTRNNVIADRARLLSLSGQDDGPYCHYIMYPGDEIPEWFSYQTDGGNSINILLPPNWFKLPFRFAFCIVFYELYNHVGTQELTTEFEFNFKTNTRNSDDRLYKFCGTTDCIFPVTTDSDHVYIFSRTLSHSELSKVSGPNWSSICSNITEASFRVSFRDRKDRYLRIIKKLGLVSVL